MKKFSDGQKKRPIPVLVFGQRLKEAREHAGQTLAEMAEEVGCRLDTINRMEHGKNRGIDIAVLVGLATWCERHGLSAAWLMANEGPMLKTSISHSLTLKWLGTAPIEELLTEHGRLVTDLQAVEAQIKLANSPAQRRQWLEAMSPGDVSDLRAQAESPADTAGYIEVPGEDVRQPDWDRNYVPVINAVAAGEGIETAIAEQYPAGRAESYVAYQGAPRGAMAVRVSGHSMEPDYRDGDMIILDPARSPRSGQPAVVVYTINGGHRAAKLKIFRRRRGKIVLESINEAYAPIELAADQVAAAYAVHDHLRKG